MLQNLVAGRWRAGVSARPLEMLIGFCIFITAAAGGAVTTVASASLAILFITCLFFIRQWPDLWRALSNNERLLLFGFILYAFSGLISYYNASDDYEYIKIMGRYIRFLMVVPVYLLLTKGNMLLLRYLVAGAVVSGPLYLALALFSISEKPGLPASGHYHHITFGDAAMLSVVFLSAVLLMWKTGLIIKAIFLISIACALYASILSQARGAWLVLPFCGMLLLYIMFKRNQLKFKIVLPLLFLAMTVIAMSPVSSLVGERVGEAVHEVTLFVSGERFDSSVGARLAMWDIALNVWQQHPVLGTGLGDFDQEIELRQSQGVYESIAVHGSAHNIYFQALATTGSIGFLVLCFALIIQPLKVFYCRSHEQFTSASLGGLMVIVAFALFGLTESWILRAPVVSIYLIYLITLSVIVSRVSDKEVPVC